jgi:hypothetical protein
MKIASVWQYISGGDSMRKWYGFFILASILLVVGNVHAQGQVIINQLQVRLWPEYDRPSLLVIYDFELAPGTALPAKVTLRIPTDAEIIAVARDVNGQLANMPYETPVVKDGWQEVTLETNSNTYYHLEYYVPIQKTGANRHFDYIWPGDYSVNTLVVEVQEPADTTSFSSNPELNNTGKSQDGFTLHSETIGSVNSGEQWVLGVDYSRSSDQLSAVGQGVQPSGDIFGQNNSSTSTVAQFISQNLQIILAVAVVAAILLIVVGVVWYWLSGRETSGDHGRKRHPSQVEGKGTEQAYCHQCGMRAQPGDKFCRACGIRLQRKEE